MVVHVMLSVHSLADTKSAGKLKKMISDEDIIFIARDHMTDWEGLATFLGFRNAEKIAIGGPSIGNVQKMRRKLLQDWKTKNGSKATYEVLIKAAESAEDETLATAVKCMSEGKLKEMISDLDIIVIARDHMTDWEVLATFLGFTNAKKIAIGGPSIGDVQKMRRKLLQDWKTKKGSNATYEALIEAAEKAQDGTLATAVKSMC